MVTKQGQILASENNTIRGIGFAVAGYAFLATQDAIVKLLVASYAVPQILLMRSILIILFVFLYSKYRGNKFISINSNKSIILARSLCTFGAWLAFYTASRDLQLAEMTAIYFSAPIIVVVLSLLFLRENVSFLRWVSVVIGFVGVLVAVNPTGRAELKPAMLCLCASFFWAVSAILVRKASAKESSLNQMIWGSVIFAFFCSFAMPFVWVYPIFEDIYLIILLGAVGSLGQYFLYEGFRLAPASTVAPVEYTMLIWAIGFGFLIWNDVPSSEVFWGGALIISSGLILFRRPS